MSEPFKEAVLIKSPSFGPNAGDACAVTLLFLQTLQISVAEHVSLQNEKSNKPISVVMLFSFTRIRWECTHGSDRTSARHQQIYSAQSSASLWDFFK